MVKGNKNEFAKRKPTEADLAKARRMARKVSARLAAMFDAKEIEDKKNGS